jgi:hypothetical protein
MTNQTPIIQSLHEGCNFHSPFTKILGLGYYDGPTNGVLQVGTSGQIYRFDLVDELHNPEGLDLRLFVLAPLPSTALVRLEHAYAPYWTPQWPLWVPIWHFPNPADRQAVEKLTDEVLQQAAPAEWVIATQDLLGEISTAKAVTPDQISQVIDWPAFLGLANQPTITD